MNNESGIHPSGDRVLIRPDDVEEVTAGGIIIPGTVGELHAMAQSIGIFVEAGPDAYLDYVETEESDSGKIVRKRGFSKPFACSGDRVAFAKYGGLQVEGKDGKSYRIMNDVDVTAIVEDGVSFTDLKSRVPVSQSKR